jgi:hydroxybutyrate-dimer hydrolase
VARPMPSCCCLLLPACGQAPARLPRRWPLNQAPAPEFLVSPVRETRHVESDDLLSAGLGLEGLRSAAPACQPTRRSPRPAELRRLAIHTSWTGIADLDPRGGIGEPVWRRATGPGPGIRGAGHVPGARHPHRVLAQVPDSFDDRAPCLLVGPRFGLARRLRCDRPGRRLRPAARLRGRLHGQGRGHRLFRFRLRHGCALDGTRGPAGADVLAFEPAPAEGEPRWWP